MEMNLKLDISKQLENVTPLFPGDTKVSCPELLRDNSKCQADGRHNFKKRRWMKEIWSKTVLRNGGAQPFKAFQRPAMCVACLLQCKSIPGYSLRIVNFIN